MATLEELRAQLDGIDNEIIELYKKRMDVCMEIGDIKIRAIKCLTSKGSGKNWQQLPQR